MHTGTDEIGNMYSTQFFYMKDVNIKFIADVIMKVYLI